jgi:hypothetical protein
MTPPSHAHNELGFHLWMSKLVGNAVAPIVKATPTAISITMAFAQEPTSTNVGPRAIHHLQMPLSLCPCTEASSNEHLQVLSISNALRSLLP